MQLQLPTIHLNGTSRESLLEGLENASNALEAAYQALKQIAPHGRDYYPQGPDALGKATEEHISRLKRLDRVKDEIDELTRQIVRIGV